MCKHFTRFAQQLANIQKIAKRFVAKSVWWAARANFEECVLGRLNGELQAFSRSRSSWAM